MCLIRAPNQAIAYFEFWPYTTDKNLPTIRIGA